MRNPWENCTRENWNGFEGAVLKHECGIWSDEKFHNWLSEYCERCPFFASGEACIYGDEDIMKLMNQYKEG